MKLGTNILRRVLIKTEYDSLVENSPGAYFWGNFGENGQKRTIYVFCPVSNAILHTLHTPNLCVVVVDICRYKYIDIKIQYNTIQFAKECFEYENIVTIANFGMVFVVWGVLRENIKNWLKALFL